MATSKTNKSKTTKSARTTKSVSPIKKRFKVNKWMALGVVVVLAGIGYYFVSQSRASNTTFALYAQNREVYGGTLTNKGGGPYARVQGYGEGGVNMPQLVLPVGTQQVCTHLKINRAAGFSSSYRSAGLKVDFRATPGIDKITDGLTKTATVSKVGYTTNICLRVLPGTKYFRASAYAAYPGDEIALYSFYGLPY